MLLPGLIFDLAFPWMFIGEPENFRILPIVVVSAIIMAIPVGIFYFMVAIFMFGHAVFLFESVFRFVFTGKWRFDLYAIVLACLVILSCDTSEKAPGVDINQIYGSMTAGIFIVTIDSCEYVVYSGTYKGNIVHKENCSNKIHNTPCNE